MRPPVTLTHRLDEYSKEPGHMNRHVRLRYATVQEHLDQAMSIRMGRGDSQRPCPICDFYRAHLGEDVRDVERIMLRDRDWGAWSCCDTIKMTRRYNNAGTHPHGELMADEIQHDCALALAEYHTDAAIRPHLEQLLLDPTVERIAPKALYVLIALLNRCNPNPRRFLAQVAARPWFPPDLALDQFAAPDFD